jgi:outer membrane protein assembly factor BamB
MKVFLKSGVKLSIITFTMVIMFAFASGALALDWWQWRGPNQDGVSTETGWEVWGAEGPKQVWKTSVGTGYSTVAVSDGRLYVMGNRDKMDTIYCLDAKTGEKIWKHSYPCAAEGDGHPGTASAPTVYGKVVYTVSREGDVHCLDAETGKLVWSKDLPRDFGITLPRWGVASSPLILDNMMILDCATTVALDKSTGDLIWKTKDYGDSWGLDSHGGGYSSPYAFHLNGKKLIAVFNSTGLVILEPEDGKELMLYPWKTDWNVNAAIPIVVDDKIFISSGYNSGCALVQISNGKLVTVWKNKNMRNHMNSSVLWEGYIYGFDESQLRCLDWETGEVEWTQRGLGKGSLMIADGKLIMMGDKGDLAIAEASPDGYKELAKAKVLSGLCWTVPVLSNGMIYCRNHDGDLICIDVKK